MQEFRPEQKLNELLQLPAETEVVEFKEANNDFDFRKLGRYFSALCNEAALSGKPEAWLVFGVEDKSKQVNGSQCRSGNRAHLDSLKAEIAQKTTNNISFVEIYELNLNGKRVVMFKIPPAPAGIPVAWEGHYYGRNGEALGPLNIEEIERLRKLTVYADWSAAVIPGIIIEQLEPAAIEKARTNFLMKNPRLRQEAAGWTTSTFLNKVKLATAEGLTRAAVILLGKPETAVLLQPCRAEITWVLYTKEKEEKDYQHFYPPYILAVDDLYAKIRNLKYRYISQDSLFPEETDQYDIESIREALCNCIAHMNYETGGRIGVSENEDGYLIFSNPGSFIPGSIESVINSEVPPAFYRNALLASAMVSFNMIDSIGSGIKRMFRKQRERFFPMPDYELLPDMVRVMLTGKVLDMSYARALAQNPELSLHDIMLLDKIQKKKRLAGKELSYLKGKGLIEGRKPNYHISVSVAETTGQKADYIKSRGFKDSYYKNMILEFLKKYGSASRSDIDTLLLDILPRVLTPGQRENKVRNLLYALSKKDKAVINTGTIRNPKWQLFEQKVDEK